MKIKGMKVTLSKNFKIQIANLSAFFTRFFTATANRNENTTENQCSGNQQSQRYGFGQKNNAAGCRDNRHR